jgi:hypothetical protein
MENEIINKIETTLKQFCKEFGLKYELRILDKLSNREIVLLNTLFAPNTEKFLKDEQTFEEHLKNYEGIGNIYKTDVVRLKKLISSIEKNKHISGHLGRRSLFFKKHQKYFEELKHLYRKIIKQKLVDAVPLMHFENAAFFIRDYSVYHGMLHEGIHYILSKNKISYNVSRLDEGLCTYLHRRIAGKLQTWAFYVGTSIHIGPYTKWAAVFEKMFAGKEPKEIMKELRWPRKKLLKFFDKTELSMH